MLENDPFKTLDPEGPGALMEIAAQKGRSVNPELHLGICGEHGGDLESVKFCCRAGMSYVSASPFRVPIARLAAAQSAIEQKKAGSKKTAKTTKASKTTKKK